MGEYPAELKAKMVEKLLLPGGPSATALSKEIGIPQATLSRWLRAAVGTEGGRNPVSDPRQPEAWTAEQKLEAVLETASLSEQDLGSYLRSRGLHRAHLEQWRSQMVRGLEGDQRPRPKAGKTPEGKRIRALEKELRRKESALAETAALLVLQKKARALWGDEDDATTRKSASRSSG